MPQFDAGMLLREYGDEALVRDLAHLLIETTPAQVEAVHTAVGVGDGHALRAAAHKLRGSIVAFGVPAAVEAARTLEEMGAAGNLSGADTISRKLAADVESLRTSAKEWLEGDARPS